MMRAYDLDGSSDATGYWTGEIVVDDERGNLLGVRFRYEEGLAPLVIAASLHFDGVELPVALTADMHRKIEKAINKELQRLNNERNDE